MPSLVGSEMCIRDRHGDGNNVFGEKMFRIENNYERRKEVRIPVKIWWVKVLFLGIMLTNQE